MHYLSKMTTCSVKAGVICMLPLYFKQLKGTKMPVNFGQHILNLYNCQSLEPIKN